MTPFADVFQTFRRRFSVDWILLAAVLPIVAAGLITMNSLGAESGFFTRQLIWVGISLLVFFVTSFIDWRFLRRTGVVIGLYAASVSVLLALFIVGSAFKGAQSWFNLGFFAIQPVDPTKLVVIILLAKYFSRRHVEIAQLKHVLISGIYVFIIFALVLVQPDFGSAMIIALIWLGMVFVSGISKKHLAIVALSGILAFAGLWAFVFNDYQKDRVLTFLHPLADIQGAGYHSFQSMVAVGSGQLLGKGVGYGTQSRLEFLPEYETDFIFAAFAEEWGFVGVVLLFVLYAIVIWRLTQISLRSASNFETLFGLGLVSLFMAHFFIHVGISIGLLPITGTTIPFMSYGGSHLVTEFAGLGILMGMRRYEHVAHRADLEREFLGPA
jgi:rod shape determining protein RodA